MPETINIPAPLSVIKETERIAAERAANPTVVTPEQPKVENVVEIKPEHQETVLAEANTTPTQVSVTDVKPTKEQVAKWAKEFGFVEKSKEETPEDKIKREAIEAAEYRKFGIEKGINPEIFDLPTTLAAKDDKDLVFDAWRKSHPKLSDEAATKMFNNQYFQNDLPIDFIEDDDAVKEYNANKAFGAEQIKSIAADIRNQSKNPIEQVKNAWQQEVQKAKIIQNAQSEVNEFISKFPNKETSKLNYKDIDGKEQTLEVTIDNPADYLNGDFSKQLNSLYTNMKLADPQGTVSVEDLVPLVKAQTGWYEREKTIAAHTLAAKAVEEALAPYKNNVNVAQPSGDGAKKTLSPEEFQAAKNAAQQANMQVYTPR